MDDQIPGIRRLKVGHSWFLEFKTQNCYMQKEPDGCTSVHKRKFQMKIWFTSFFLGGMPMKKIEHHFERK